MKISQNFVAFSEYMNLTLDQNFLTLETSESKSHYYWMLPSLHSTTVTSSEFSDLTLSHSTFSHNSYLWGNDSLENIVIYVIICFCKKMVVKLRLDFRQIIIENTDLIYGSVQSKWRGPLGQKRKRIQEGS